ncbi:hypothetical protein GCM10010172_29290 [Paractinoplanes ferrugineus]|uniref:Uncharacterized protein n=2 Tax=Paractinoplanes ferrugineus TaxID=113564 RepID=A0A919M6C0_9ACTN|nr:hypothetical protein Afe05nite_00010 [Actinoplanes ferrugineus]
MFYWMVARRNQLTHSRVSIGYSQVDSRAPREAVIALLYEIQPGRNPVPWNDAPKLDGYRNPDDSGWTGDDGDFSEHDVEVDLRRLYVCLEVAVDIHEAIRRKLELGS